MNASNASKSHMIKSFAIKSFLLFLLGLSAWCYGQPPAVKLLGFQSSACDEAASISRIQERIVSQAVQGDIYQVTIGTIANCAGIHAAETAMSGDTLKISYSQGIMIRKTMPTGEPYEEHLYFLCECCFEFTFTVQGVNRLPGVVAVNDSVLKYYPEKYKIYPVRFQLFEGDTINRVDKYGFRQGYWYEGKEHDGYLSGRFRDDELVSLDRKEYYSPGKLKLVSIRNDTLSAFSTHYYENGALKSTYLQAGKYEEEKSFYPDGRLEKIKAKDLYRTYYPNGALRSEKPYRSPNHVREQFFYEDGRPMAIHYVKPGNSLQGVEHGNGPGKAAGQGSKGDSSGLQSWWECYDQQGRPVSREFLLEAGYTQLKE